MSLTSGIYRIKSLTDNTYLDNNDPSLGTHTGTDESHTDINWEVEQLQDEMGFTIKNAFSKQPLFGQKALDGARVDTHKYQSSTWDLVRNDENVYWVYLKGFDLALEASRTESSGAKWLHLRNVDKTSVALQWAFEQVGGIPVNEVVSQIYSNPVVQPGCYVIRNFSTSTVLDIADSGRENGTPIGGWQYHGGSNQKWELIPGTNGYRVRSFATGTYLSHDPWTTPEHGIRLIGHSNDQAEWDIRQDGEAMQLVYAGKDVILDLARDDSTNGTEVILYQNNHSGNQKWLFEPC